MLMARQLVYVILSKAKDRLARPRRSFASLGISRRALLESTPLFSVLRTSNSPSCGAQRSICRPPRPSSPRPSDDSALHRPPKNFSGIFLVGSLPAVRREANQEGKLGTRE